MIIIMKVFELGNGKWVVISRHTCRRRETVKGCEQNMRTASERVERWWWWWFYKIVGVAVSPNCPLPSPSDA